MDSRGLPQCVVSAIDTRLWGKHRVEFIGFVGHPVRVPCLPAEEEESHLVLAQGAGEQCIATKITKSTAIQISIAQKRGCMNPCTA